MRVSILLALTVLAAAAYPAPGHAAPVRGVRGNAKAAFSALYAKADADLAKNDVKGYESFFAPNFVVIDPSGKKTARADVMRELRQELRVFQNVRASASVRSVDAKGATAVALVATKVSARQKGPDGKLHALVYSRTSKDTWTKRGARWLLVRRAILSGSVTVDGKLAGKV